MTGLRRQVDEMLDAVREAGEPGLGRKDARRMVACGSKCREAIFEYLLKTGVIERRGRHPHGSYVIGPVSSEGIRDAAIAAGIAARQARRDDVRQERRADSTRGTRCPE